MVNSMAPIQNRSMNSEGDLAFDEFMYTGHGCLLVCGFTR